MTLLSNLRHHQLPCGGTCPLQQGLHLGIILSQLNPRFWLLILNAQVLTPRVQEPEKKRQEPGAVGPYGPPPLTLLFGWAGSTDKNLAKYSKIYLNQVLDFHLHLAIGTQLAVNIAIKKFLNNQNWFCSQFRGAPLPTGPPPPATSSGWRRRWLSKQGNIW